MPNRDSGPGGALSPSTYVDEGVLAVWRSSGQFSSLCSGSTPASRCRAQSSNICTGFTDAVSSSSSTSSLSLGTHTEHSDAAQGATGLEVSSDPPGSILSQMLDATDVETRPTTAFELHSSSEIGLDLVAVESFGNQIARGTSTLLVLVEARWATELLDEVVDSGGFPVVSGCLEPETMLVVGPELASAAEARANTAVIATAAGVAKLDAFANGPEASSAVAADLVRALVTARFIDPADVAETIDLLVNGRLAPPSSR